MSIFCFSTHYLWQHSVSSFIENQVLSNGYIISKSGFSIRGEFRKVNYHNNWGYLYWVLCCEIFLVKGDKSIYNNSNGIQINHISTHTNSCRGWETFFPKVKLDLWDKVLCSVWQGDRSGLVDSYRNKYMGYYRIRMLYWNLKSYAMLARFVHTLPGK